LSGDLAAASSSSDDWNTSSARFTDAQPACTSLLPLAFISTGSWYLVSLGFSPIGLGSDTYSGSSTAPRRAFSSAFFTPSIDRLVGSLPKPVITPLLPFKATRIPSP
jgi:hypothetical protein